MCDRIALIQTGRILSIDTPTNIVKSYPDVLYAIKANNMFSLLKTLPACPGVKDSYAFGEFAHASFGEEVSEREIFEFLNGNGLRDIKVGKKDPTIEDCFIKLLKS
jgi:ABC-type multidrug transport system ATPase subunit